MHPGRPAMGRPGVRWLAGPRATVAQFLDAARTAVATSTVSSPSCMVTMSAGFPRTASRKFSISPTSASRLATA